MCYEERDLGQPLSFVLSSDVIAVVQKILFDNQIAQPGSFNLACPEQLTLPELQKAILKELQVQLKTDKSVEFEQTKGEYCYKFFPSVNCGPISIAKAQE